MFNSSSTYNSILSFFSLGLESSLPLPQFLSNQSRKSLAGFRISVLLGWLFGDGFKTVYFIVNSSPLPFLLGGIFALTIDIAIVAQWKMFEEKTKSDEEQERLVAEERQRREAGDRTGVASAGGGGATASRLADRQQRTKASSQPSAQTGPREASLDEELEDAQPVLFDSPYHSSSAASAATGKVFTIEADDE